jgi:hypothetical protein
MPPVVTSLTHLGERFVAFRAWSAPNDDHALDRRTLFNRLVAIALERYDLAAAIAPVRRDEKLGLRVVDAVA